MNFSLITLGCPKNQVDSEKLVTRLERHGHVYREEPGDAEVLLVNTCSFITPAKEESIETILASAGTGKRLLVLGCLPERYRDELRAELPEVEAFFGVGEEDRIVRHLEGSSGSPSEISGDGRVLLNPSHYAYLKIAEGCDNRCTYCVIPSVRGAYRSRPAADLQAEARQLYDGGVRELILVAQDTTAYGQDIGTDLATLAETLSDLPFPWIRIMYAYPDRVTERLLDGMAARDNLLPYLDLPLQHSEPSVLKRMGRAGTPDPRQLLERIRTRLPGVTIRTTVIVGFPGETNGEFEGLLRFVEEMKLDRLGAFTYSREEGTPAARMDHQVSDDVMSDRLDRLMAAQARVSHARNQSLLGKTLAVLVDESEDGVSIGRTVSDAPDVDGNVILREPVTPGSFVQARVTGAQDYDLEAVLADGQERDHSRA